MDLSMTVTLSPEEIEEAIKVFSRGTCKNRPQAGLSFQPVAS